MKKFLSLILAISFMLALTACKNEAQEQLVVYSFYGENDCFKISNGTIVLSDSEDIFYGGSLHVTEPESIIDISSYKATFYTVTDGQREIILVDELHNSSSAELLEVSLGKIVANDSELNQQFKNIEQLNGKVFCELETTDKEGNKNSYTIEMELTKITK